MTTAAARPIAFLNTSYDEVEKMLLDGKTPREVADYLAEPVGNVMGVWSGLRDAGKVKATNFPAAAAGGAPAVPTPPRHMPDLRVTEPISRGANDLLTRAAAIDDKRIQAALARARKAMTDLAGLVTTWQSKSAARNRIARLEAELRIARAELRDAPKQAGGGTAPADPSAPTPDVAVEDDGVTCRRGCGRNDFTTKQSRGQHERHCAGAEPASG
jgi:hypothetical protein